MEHRKLTDDERALLNHWGMWGSDGYPIRKLGRGWTWGDWRSIKGSPTVFKTKKAAVESFERYIDVLIGLAGEESRRRALSAKPATGYQIPAPPGDPDYHKTAAGYIGDYRPLEERQADPDAPGSTK